MTRTNRTTRFPKPAATGGATERDRDLVFRCEQGLIGAVLILGAKDERAKRLLRSVTGFDFAEPMHSWLWGQLRRGELTVESSKVCRTKFRRFLVSVALKCLEQAYWWHCDYYLEVVAEAAAKRNL